MILSLDNLAAKYHLLPSEALERATTFDLYVLDTGARWIRYQHELAESNAKGGPPPTPKLTEAQMKAMIAKVKERKK
jgi:hypothetical protein